MEYEGLVTLMRVALENGNRDNYNDHVRMEILKGLWQVSEVLLESLKGNADHSHYDYTIRELELMQDYVESGMKGERGLEETLALIQKDVLHRLFRFPEELE